MARWIEMGMEEWIREWDMLQQQRRQQWTTVHTCRYVDLQELVTELHTR